MSMTKKDYKVWAEILGQIIWSHEDLGANPRMSRGAIDDRLKQNNKNYDGNKFWTAVEQEVRELQELFRDEE